MVKTNVTRRTSRRTVSFRSDLISLPDNIRYCKQLTSLDCSSNRLERLCEGLTMLISLQALYLNDTLLEFLPGNFGRSVTKRRSATKFFSSRPRSVFQLDRITNLGDARDPSAFSTRDFAQINETRTIGPRRKFFR